MVNRRDDLLDAAITVLGEGGMRALTHRAVDAAAGLPAGSTSNYFRTRDALLGAVIDRFVGASAPSPRRSSRGTCPPRRPRWRRPWLIWPRTVGSTPDPHPGPVRDPRRGGDPPASAGAAARGRRPRPGVLPELVKARGLARPERDAPRS
ncbi:TetR/AcrR family transcriptional regulator [Luedemannella flava]